MSMATLEREIVREAQVILKNKKLRLKDIMEWSTGEIEEVKCEVIFSIPSLGVNVAVDKAMDKREIENA